MSINLIIVTALACEARPLSNYYRLQKISHPATYPLFSNEQKSLHLIVSGVGQINSAAATAYSFGVSKANKHTCFLNVGIAGSAHFAVGECILANKITQAASQRSFYPWITKQIATKQADLMTYDTPQTDYQHHSLCDMEAYGFFASALHFVTKEQIQVLKIVSDNDPKSLSQLTKNYVTQLINQNLKSIDDVVNNLSQLSLQQFQRHRFHPQYDAFKERWHFTMYQQHQLAELLRRWNVVYPQKNAFDVCHSEKESKSVLECLHAELAEAVY